MAFPGPPGRSPFRAPCARAVAQRIVQLAAQAPHGHFHHIGFAVEVHVPHLLGERRSGQHAPLAAHQQGEQGELLGGQVDPHAFTVAFACNQIEFQVGQFQHGVLLQRPPALQGLHPRQQFGEREGLDQIVVSALLQTSDAILDLIAGRDHQYGHVLALPNGGQHAETIHPGQHHVEQDDRVIALRGEVPALDAVPGNVHHVTVFFQAFLT